MNRIFSLIGIGLFFVILANISFVDGRIAAAGQGFAASPGVSVLKESADTKKVEGALAAEILYSQSPGSHW